MNVLPNGATRVYVLASTPILEYGIVASLIHQDYPQLEPIPVTDRTGRISPVGSVIIKTFLGDDIKSVIATRDRFPTIPMLALGQLGHLQDPAALKRVGVNAVLDLRASPEELRQAVVNLTMEGSRGNAWRGAVADSPIEPRALPPRPEARLNAANLSRLSAREMEILRLVQQGARNKEIAATLILSENTVKTHIQRIMAKLDVNNRTQAAMLASGATGQRIAR